MPLLYALRQNDLELHGRVFRLRALGQCGRPARGLMDGERCARASCRSAAVRATARSRRLEGLGHG